ncbi:MAG: phosphoglycerate dehydrogenase [Chloroflexi bacterium]|nr:phosphoglycerate dehydrogenase [Chloroflexota bacterium]
MRVLIADSIAAEGAGILVGHQVEVDTRTGLSPDQLAAIIGDYDGLIVRSETKVTAAILDAGKRLQVVGRAGVGVDNIDLDAATQLGVVVVNAPSSNTIAAAEHTMALILSLARHVPQAHGSMKDGRWERRDFMGTELLSKALGIVGLGRIGVEVARRASGFGMHIIGFDPFISAEQARNLGVELASLDDLLERSDCVTLHTPLIESTRNLIAKPQLARMKRGAFLVNCARGGLVNEDDLYQSLEDGHLGGAALDVFVTEPPGSTPLIRHPRVVVTPHLGASTTEAQAGVAREIAEQVMEVLEGRTPRYAVNAPLVAQETYSELAPYIPVAVAAGRLASQLVDGQPSGLSISYRGEVAQYETAILRAAALRGFLERSSDERINLVNATMAAQRRGLLVEEHKTEDLGGTPYSNLLVLDVTTTTGKTSVSATLTQNEVHIVLIDAYRVDVVPSGGPWIMVSHRDRPGMIGAIGTITGQQDINIASMQVSRQHARGPAMTVLGLDEAVNSVQLAAIAAIPDVDRVRVVQL